MMKKNNPLQALFSAAVKALSSHEPCGSSRCAQPSRSLRIEFLEERLVPATLTDGGTATLTITLDNANEALEVVSNGATYTFTTNNTFVDGGVANPGTDFDAFGNATIDLLAPGLATYDTINIVDSATGATVTFNDSGANAYSDDFTVTLDDVSGGVTFDGASQFPNVTVAADATITQNAGSNITATTLASFTATGAASDVSLGGTVNAATLTAIADNDVTVNDGIAVNVTMNADADADTGGTATATALDADVLTATAGAGGITIAEADDVSVTSLTTSAGSNGNIAMTTTDGAITTTGAINADGAGGVQLTANGVGNSISLGGNVDSGFGNIDLSAANDIAANGNNITTAADVNLIADNDGDNAGGISTAAGTISANQLAATAATGITANTAVASIDAANTISGNITISEADDIDILAMSTAAGNGNIAVTTTDGSITTSGAVSANGSGTVNLTANGTTRDVTLGAAVTSGSGMITLGATNDVSLAGFNVTTTGDVNLAADTDADTAGSISSGAGVVSGNLLTTTAGSGITLNTNVTSLNASNTTTGNIMISEANAVTVTGMTTLGGGGNIALTTANGAINTTGLISADGAGLVTLTANGAGNDISLGANVTSGAGIIILTADRDVLTNAASVTTSGLVFLNATNQDVIVGSGTIAGTAGTVTFNAGRNVTLGAGSTVTAGTNVTINPGVVVTPHAVLIQGTINGTNRVVNGGAGMTTLTVDDGTGRLFNLTGANAGNIVGVLENFNNVETLSGGAANDTFRFADGVNTNVSVLGGAGIDALDYSLYTTAVTVNVGGTATNTNGNNVGFENVFGGMAADTINGDGGPNLLVGNAGNDTIDGGAGNDTIDGSAGDDLLNGGADDDLMVGGDGNDTINGDGGNDTIAGNQGSDFVAGGAGNNIYMFEDPTGVQTDTITTTAGAADWIDFCMLMATDPLRNFRLPGAGNGSGLQGSGGTLRTFVIVNPENVVTLVGTAGADVVDIQNGRADFYWDGNANVVDIVIRDANDLLFGNCPPAMDPFGGESISGNPGEANSKGGIIVDGEPFGPQICNIFPGQTLGGVIQYILNLQSDLLGATDVGQATELATAVTNNNLESFHIVRFFLLKNDTFMFRFLDQTYVSLLGRNITIPEAQTWIEAFHDGLLYEDAVAQILASDEFFTKAASSSVQLIQDVFSKMLGRAATQQDIDGFLDLVGDGANDGRRLIFAESVLDSTEFHNNQVTRWIDLFFTAPNGPDTSDTRDLAILKLEQGGNWVEALEIILNGYCILKPTEGVFTDYFDESQLPGAIAPASTNSVIGFTTDSPDFVGGAPLPYEQWVDTASAQFWSELGKNGDWVSFYELIQIKEAELQQDGEIVTEELVADTTSGSSDRQGASGDLEEEQLLLI